MEQVAFFDPSAAYKRTNCIEFEIDEKSLLTAYGNRNCERA